MSKRIALLAVLCALASLPVFILRIGENIEQQQHHERIVQETMETARQLARNAAYSAVADSAILQSFDHSLQQQIAGLASPSTDRLEEIRKTNDPRAQYLPAHDVFVVQKTPSGNRVLCCHDQHFGLFAAIGKPLADYLLQERNADDTINDSFSNSMRRFFGHSIHTDLYESRRQQRTANATPKLSFVHTRDNGLRAIYWRVQELPDATTIVLVAYIDLTQWNPLFGMRQFLTTLPDNRAVLFLPDKIGENALFSPRPPLNIDIVRAVRMLTKARGKRWQTLLGDTVVFASESVAGGYPFQAVAAVNLPSEAFGAGQRFSGSTGFLLGIFFLLLLAGPRILLDQGIRLDIRLVLPAMFLYLAMLPVLSGSIMLRLYLREDEATIRHRVRENMENTLQRLDQGYLLSRIDMFQNMLNIGKDPDFKALLQHEEANKDLASTAQFLWDHDFFVWPVKASSSMHLAYIFGHDEVGGGVMANTGQEGVEDTKSMVDRLFGSYARSLLRRLNPKLPTATPSKPEQELKPGISIDGLRDELKGEVIEELLTGVFGQNGFYLLQNETNFVHRIKLASNDLLVSMTTISRQLLPRFLILWIWDEPLAQQAYLRHQLDPVRAPRDQQIYVGKGYDLHQVAMAEWAFPPDLQTSAMEVRQMRQPRWIDGLDDNGSTLSLIAPNDQLSVFLLGSRCSLAPFIAETTKARNTLLTLFLLTVLLTTVAVFMVCRHVLQPLRKLAYALRQVSMGVFSIRLEEGRRDEFGTVAHIYNRLVQGLFEGSLLKQHVSTTVQRLADDPAALEQAKSGSRRQVTILFSSLRDFSGFCRVNPPVAQADLLDHHLGCADRLAREYGGEIDKIMGENIMIVFDHETLGGAEHAAGSALRLAESLHGELATIGQSLGIGINSGNVLAGIIGSTRLRMDYTVIGDAVNLAARLKAEAQALPQGGIVLSEEVRQHLPETVPCEQLSFDHVRGKLARITAFQIVTPPVATGK